MRGRREAVAEALAAAGVAVTGAAGVAFSLVEVAKLAEPVAAAEAVEVAAVSFFGATPRAAGVHVETDGVFASAAGSAGFASGAGARFTTSESLVVYPRVREDQAELL